MSEDASGSDIVFLDYLSRSGSTYFANKLSAISRVVVTPEPKIVSNSQAKIFSLPHKDALSDYLDQRYCDPKFLTWNVSRQALESELARQKFPLSHEMVLRSLLKIAFPKPTNHIWVVKGGGFYTLNFEDYLEKYSTLKILLIVRDPRATFSSQCKSLDSVTGRPMEANLARFIFRARKQLRGVKHQSAKAKIKVIRYEDLLECEDIVLAQVCDFLNVSSEETAEKDYVGLIPDSQKHLHENVMRGGPLKNRKDGWRSELDKNAARCIEIFLSPYLDYFSYEKVGGGSLAGAAYIVSRDLLKLGYRNARRLIGWK